MKSQHQGLIAAALTPFQANGKIDLACIEPLSSMLRRKGIAGLYVCGSTGEGISLTIDERKEITEAYVRAADDMFVFVQVGHNSLEEARKLAAHAATVGVDAISATCPSYFKVGTIRCLVDCMAHIASAAPELPFYYYHIPGLTGNNLNMVHFLEQAAERIPNLAGIKFTAPQLHSFQQCAAFDAAKQIFWGTDEMLLAALACGAKAAIGSTYNVLAPLFHELIQAFEGGDLTLAQQIQLETVDIIDILLRYPFHAALKHAVHLSTNSSISLGGARLPLENLTAQQKKELEKDLQATRFFEQTTIR